MAKKKIKIKKSQLTRKRALVHIEKMLESHLGDLHMALGEKKFKRRIKKVSKMLTSGLPKDKKRKLESDAIVTEPILEESMPMRIIVEPQM